LDPYSTRSGSVLSAPYITIVVQRLVISMPGKEYDHSNDVTHGIESSRLGSSTTTCGQKAKHTAVRIPAWSPTAVLIHQYRAYVWQSGRDAQFSRSYGRMCLPFLIINIYTTKQYRQRLENGVYVESGW
jgi:hypothetical protein